MVIKVPLTKGEYALIDDDDLEIINKYKWHCTSHGYASSVIPGDSKRLQYMHRFLLNAPEGMSVDHINHNKLDNRRKNLRICTHKENTRNSRSSVGKSQFKGVSYKPGRKKPWRSRIHVNGEQIIIGDFVTEIEAAHAYDLAAKEYFGEFAYLNGVEVPNFKQFKPRKQASSQRGVAWCNTKKRWRTTIKINGKSIHLGYFRNEIDAINSRLNYEKKLKEEGIAN